ncbi:MAG: VOC family protein [Clostridiaceae bacterium]
MKLGVYLVTNGNGKEVAEYYGKVFDRVPRISTFGEMPEDPNFVVTDELRDLVMNAEIVLSEDHSILLSDNMPGAPLTVGDNVTIVFNDDDTEVVTKIFNSLAEGGKIEMPLQPTFWSALYGAVVDKYGFYWNVNCSQAPTQS